MARFSSVTGWSRGKSRSTPRITLAAGRYVVQRLFQRKGSPQRWGSERKGASQWPMSAHMQSPCAGRVWCISPSQMSRLRMTKDLPRTQGDFSLFMVRSFPYPRADNKRSPPCRLPGDESPPEYADPLPVRNKTEGTSQTKCILITHAAETVKEVKKRTGEAWLHIILIEVLQYRQCQPENVKEE
jgi:hypothetical protein